MSVVEPSEGEVFLRIGEAACRLGVSERALRYYEELGLVLPACHSPGGNRRYGEAELARVRRIRELQDLMGLSLDEVRTVLEREDRLDALRARFQASEDDDERRRLLEEGVALTEPLRARVEAKRVRLTAFRDELDEKLGRYRTLLAELARHHEPARPGRRPPGSP